MAKKKEITIRSGAAEYLSYVASVGDQPQNVELRYEDENIWLTQRLMAELYGVEVSTVNEHISKVFSDGELQEEATIRKFRIVQQEGNRMVNRENKLHYAIHGHTAAELIMERADAEKDHMGLTTWEDAPTGKVRKSDVTIAKNYLSEDELTQLGRMVSAYLDLAESMALRHIPMTMEDWEIRLNGFLTLMDREVLSDAGKVSAEMAKIHAETEWEKYRIVQDRLYQSDFDRFLLLEEESATIAKQSQS